MTNFRPLTDTEQKNIDSLRKLLLKIDDKFAAGKLSPEDINKIHEKTEKLHNYYELIKIDNTKTSIVYEAKAFLYWIQDDHENAYIAINKAHRYNSSYQEESVTGKLIRKEASEKERKEHSRAVVGSWVVAVIFFFLIWLAAYTFFSHNSSTQHNPGGSSFCNNADAHESGC